MLLFARTRGSARSGQMLVAITQTPNSDHFEGRETAVQGAEDKYVAA